MGISKEGERGGSPRIGADILLVEDDPADAEFTLGALDQCGLGPKVTHVTDGAEAVDYLCSAGSYVRSGPAPLPRLILLDLGLGKFGGLQALRRLKSEERTHGIPVVVLTGSKTTIELAESYKLGANSYIIKPMDTKKFAALVAEISRYWLEVNAPPPGQGA